MRTWKRYLNRLIAWFVSLVLRPSALQDPVNFRIWERRGYHITPNHFYHPIPDTRTIKSAHRAVSDVPGIDLRPAYHASMLDKVFPTYMDEYNRFPTQALDPQEFFLDNDAFAGIDPHVYYCMIRWLRPKAIVEVGSGYSTLLGAMACRVNETTVLTVVDPWPRDFVASGVSGSVHVEKRVEDLDLATFAALGAGDILFVDSSHVVRTAGDVNYIFLEVLPRLASGVVVHVHDIYLPFDYPVEMIFEQHLFWTEQYLLQAYLCENAHAEVLFASNYASHQFPHALRTAFPKALWHGGGSFWFRKR